MLARPLAWALARVLSGAVGLGGNPGAGCPPLAAVAEDQWSPSKQTLRSGHVEGTVHSRWRPSFARRLSATLLRPGRISGRRASSPNMASNPARAAVARLAAPARASYPGTAGRAGFDRPFDAYQDLRYVDGHEHLAFGLGDRASPLSSSSPRRLPLVRRHSACGPFFNDCRRDARSYASLV